MYNDLLVTDSVNSDAGGASVEYWSPYDGQVFDGARSVVESPAPMAETSDGEEPFVVRLRRREPRYPAIENRIWLQWWQDGEYLGRSARLVNVSRNGAMIVSWTLIREHQRVGVYLEEPAHDVGVNAVVLGVVEGTKGMHQIRLGFVTPCPDDFLQAAANGFESWLACRRPKL